MPYHMHINPDLLDCVHLTSAMLLELPALARGNLGSYQVHKASNVFNYILSSYLLHSLILSFPSTITQHIISKQFRKFLTGYNRQKFTGPPENTREHIMAATNCLLSGDWQKACDYILKLEVWNLIPGEGGVRVKETLKVRIKEEALRTYLIKYGAHYDSMNLSHLCEVRQTTHLMIEFQSHRFFSVTKNTVTNLLSFMT